MSKCILSAKRLSSKNIGNAHVTFYTVSFSLQRNLVRDNAVAQNRLRKLVPVLPFRNIITGTAIDEHIDVHVSETFLAMNSRVSLRTPTQMHAFANASTKQNLRRRLAWREVRM